MSDTAVSIGQVKRDISELVNRVAFAGERIVLTSRGKPKAALVSVEDYEKLKQSQDDERILHWQNWLAATDQLAEKILAERDGKPVDIDAAWDAYLTERESRDDQILGR
ncbi:type II toxin-antitoxin system Phd/YefM family antitoxin [Candidatus Leptofilum sp.]|uniref:type II toxin-antitoxin system Phd/YefM family antitoxin n=1 Tax=Candidatus Leptofilum sp. TaxID=3241576 RepID=UPI003B5AD63F